MEKTILIDICGTLYDSNTTLDFLDYTCSGDAGYRRYKAIARWLPVRIINKCCLMLFASDPLRRWGVSFLKGLPEETVQRYAAGFYANFLVQRAQHDVLALVETFRREGCRLVIVSSTLDCVAAAIARELNISTVLASALAYRNGLCTGRIKHDLLLSKYPALQSKQLLPPYHATISDNLSDSRLMQLSQRCFIVSRPKNHHKWLDIIRKKQLTQATIMLKP